MREIGCTLLDLVIELIKSLEINSFARDRTEITGSVIGGASRNK